VALLSAGAAGVGAQDVASATVAAAPPAAAFAPAVPVGGVTKAEPASGAADVRQRFTPAAPLAPAAQPESQARMHNYVRDLFDVGSAIAVFGGALVLQIANSPQEWGNGVSGYVDRAASNAGQLVVQETVQHGLAAAMGLTTEYERCGCTDFGEKAEHAAVGAVTDRNASGRRVFSVPRVAGAFAGSFATMLWWPNRSAGTAALNGGLALVGSAGWNFVWDELMRTPASQATAHAVR
jgi:hypothetical protein